MSDKKNNNKHKSLIKKPSFYKDRPQRQFLVDNLIPHPSINMIYAPSGGQKSQFALYLTSCLVNKKEFLGSTVSIPRMVLYIDGEQGADDVADRFGTFDLYSDEAESRLMYIRKEVPIDYAKDDDRNDLLELLEDLKLNHLSPDLIVFDNIRTLQTLDNENASESFKPNNDFMQLLRDKGYSVLTIHHSNKGGKSFSGSGNATTVYESVIGLTSVPNIGDGYAIKLNVDKDRAGFLESIKSRVIQREEIFEYSEYRFLEGDYFSEEDAAILLLEKLTNYEVSTLRECHAALRDSGYKFSSEKMPNLDKYADFIRANVLGQSKFGRDDMEKFLKEARIRKTA